MTTYYNINPKFYVSVDCIIFGFDEGELKDVYKRQVLKSVFQAH